MNYEDIEDKVPSLVDLTPLGIETTYTRIGSTLEYKDDNGSIISADTLQAKVNRLLNYTNVVKVPIKRNREECLKPSLGLINKVMKDLEPSKGILVEKVSYSNNFRETKHNKKTYTEEQEMMKQMQGQPVQQQNYTEASYILYNGQMVPNPNMQQQQSKIPMDYTVEQRGAFRTYVNVVPNMLTHKARVSDLRFERVKTDDGKLLAFITEPAVIQDEDKYYVNINIDVGLINDKDNKVVYYIDGNDFNKGMEYIKNIISTNGIITPANVWLKPDGTAVDLDENGVPYPEEEDDDLEPLIPYDDDVNSVKEDVKTDNDNGAIEAVSEVISAIDKVTIFISDLTERVAKLEKAVNGNSKQIANLADTVNNQHKETTTMVDSLNDTMVNMFKGHIEDVNMLLGKQMVEFAEIVGSLISEPKAKDTEDESNEAMMIKDMPETGKEIDGMFNSHTGEPIYVSPDDDDIKKVKVEKGLEEQLRNENIDWLNELTDLKDMFKETLAKAEDAYEIHPENIDDIPIPDKTEIANLISNSYDVEKGKLTKFIPGMGTIETSLNEVLNDMGDNTSDVYRNRLLDAYLNDLTDADIISKSEYTHMVDIMANNSIDSREFSIAQRTIDKRIDGNLWAEDKEGYVAVNNSNNELVELLRDGKTVEITDAPVNDFNPLNIGGDEEDDATTAIIVDNPDYDQDITEDNNPVVEEAIAKEEEKIVHLTNELKNTEKRIAYPYWVGNRIVEVENPDGTVSKKLEIYDTRNGEVIEYTDPRLLHTKLKAAKITKEARKKMLKQRG